MEKIKTENYKFYSHKTCEFFPCHETEKTENFNCLFCYCPLYALGEDCGGNFSFTDTGIKDCTNCLIPHSASGYDYIMERYGKISELIEKGRAE